MLLILIPVIWLAIAAFVVLLCRGAAAADAVIASAERVASRTALAGPVGSPVHTRTTRRRVDARARHASRASAGCLRTGGELGRTVRGLRQEWD
jgi:hypothetical protein